MTAKILFVDDDLDQCEMVENSLNPDYKVTIATNAQTALALLQELEPDLVILDIMMPEMSGYELAAAIRASHHASEVPIVFISGVKDLAHRVQSYESGGEYFLAKPWQQEELVAMVLSTLRRSQYGESCVEKPA